MSIHELDISVTGHTADEIVKTARTIAETYFGGPVNLRIYAEGEAYLMGNGAPRYFRASVHAEPTSGTL